MSPKTHQSTVSQAIDSPRLWNVAVNDTPSFPRLLHTYASTVTEEELREAGLLNDGEAVPLSAPLAFTNHLFFPFAVRRLPNC